MEIYCQNKACSIKMYAGWNQFLIASKYSFFYSFKYFKRKSVAKTKLQCLQLLVGLCWVNFSSWYAYIVLLVMYISFITLYCASVCRFFWHFAWISNLFLLCSTYSVSLVVFSGIMFLLFLCCFSELARQDWNFFGLCKIFCWQ